MGGTMFPREQIDGTVQLLFDVRIPPIGKGECLDGTGVGDGLQLMDTAVFLRFRQFGRRRERNIQGSIETIVGKQFQMLPLRAFDD